MTFKSQTLNFFSSLLVILQNNDHKMLIGDRWGAHEKFFIYKNLQIVDFSCKKNFFGDTLNLEITN